MQKIQLLAEACIRMTILKLELQNPMGGFLQHRLLGHAPSFDSEGAGWRLRSHVSHEFLDDAGPCFEMGCSRWIPRILGPDLSSSGRWDP